MQIPIVTLKNGLVVANFSSNHSKFNPTSNIAFKFDDGSELENCSLKRTKSLSLKMEDIATKSGCGRFNNIKKNFRLTNKILEEMLVASKAADIVIVPFPMLQAIFHQLGSKYVANFRTASIDRATGICSSTEFCFL